MFWNQFGDFLTQIRTGSESWFIKFCWSGYYQSGSLIFRITFNLAFPNLLIVFCPFWSPRMRKSCSTSTLKKKRIGFLPSNNSHGIIQRMREKTSGEDDEPEIICNNNFLLISSTRTWAWKLDHICQTFNQRSEEFEVIGSPFGVSQRRKKIFKGKRSTGRTKGRRRIIGRIKGIKRNNSRTFLPLCSVRPRPQRNTIAWLT